MGLFRAIRQGWTGTKLFFKYGPKLVEMGLRIYGAVEDLGDGTIVGVDEAARDRKAEFKGQSFDDYVMASKRIWAAAMGRPPTEAEAARFRKDVWEHMNPGKKPRRVSGKSRKRG